MKNLILIAGISTYLMLAFEFSTQAQNSFITTWQTNDTQITIPTSGGGYNYDISWTNLSGSGIGDGLDNGITGSYTISGLTTDTYQVQITGTFPRINFNNSGDKDKILTIEEWGTIQWSSMETAFYGCTNLTVPATDAPDLSNVLSLNQMFRGATTFNESIDHWDVSNIVLFFGMFWDATSYNQPLNNWTLTNVKSISNMFHGASSFNQPLNNWVTTGLTDIKVMFKNAVSFNQSVNNFDVSLVQDFAGTFEGATSFDQPLNNWDMSSANTLALMFYQASSFNQDLSSWDVSKVSTMGFMFGFAGSFNQNLGNWDIGEVASMTDMLFRSNLSVSNYDNTLIGWATISGSEIQIPTGITSFRAFDLSYCNAEIARQFLIDSQGWEITLDSKASICPPTITSFSPTSAAASATVILTGTDFTGATAVSFGGTPASSFIVDSPTQITAILAVGSSGSVQVITPGGTATRAGFTFIPAPTISSFTPTSAASSAIVILTGTAFTGATAVSFGGTPASSFNVDSPTQITAILAAGSSGSVQVITPGGIATRAGFTFIPAPTISSFTPTSAASSATVILTGTAFTGATAVSFGGTPASSFIVDSPTQITAILAAGSSGSVQVITPGGTATRAGFTFIPAPTISSFTPTSAAASATVILTGTAFTGATAVSFGGTPASSFIVDSPTQITAVLAAGSSGSVQVITPGGTATRAGFTFIPAPTISSFTPTSAASSAIVILTGTAFTGATAVSFGGTPASSFNVDSPTQITAILAAGSSGSVQVITPGGIATRAGFTFIPAPTISSFTPTSAASSAIVILTGTAFTGATAVSFGGTPASSFNVDSPTQITAVLAAGSSGSVQVITPGGTATRAGFTFIPAPTISSFTPTSAAASATVILTGTAFTGATAVSFGGTPASSFIVDSPTQITAVLASGSSGSVQVITPGGTATLAGFTLITSPEVNITSFTPISGALGETITITGTNFTSASFVSFGGTPATTFTVDSPTQITATLANGSSGTVEVGTPSGSASLIGFIFIPAPTITGFSPIIAASEATVTITGTNFTGTTAVSFGGTNALSFIVTSPTEINAEVANGTSGSIEVTTPGGKATLAGFEFIEGPTILSVSPTSLGANQIATIIGTGFTSTFSVSFGGTEALSFAVVSDSEITAVVGPGASGDVIVTSLGGTASFSGFKFIPAPTISSFNPTSAFEGQIVTIVGTDFLNTSSVHFGDSKAISFDVISNNEIKAVVGSESSGSVMITTLGGAASREGFTFLFSQIALSRSENNPIASEQSEPIFLGTVLTEESLQSDFIISNTGNANLLISNITSSDDAFEIVNFPSSIDPGSSGEFTVQFNDSDVGNFESEIRIENNSSNSPAFVFTVSAERSGVNVIDNETDSVIISNQNVDVGSTILNVDVNKTFNIENLSSNSVIEITSILIDNPVFQITSAPLSIAPLSTEEFTIRLNANTVGRYLAIVLVTTNLNEFSFQVVGEVLPEASTEINVYNVVTPNGDGRHDYLQIENITEYTNNSVSIYNRFGNKVFDINNYNNSSNVFEGLSNNGEELLTGNYYYVIDKGNGDKRITGFLLIKR